MSSNELTAGALLGGRLRLVRKIGRGGMGDVWLAHNEATAAEVAIKTLHPAARSPENDDRFRREARLAATIAHRNVVKVFDLVDEPGGSLGLVMERLRGSTLEALLTSQPVMTPLDAMAIVLPILSALDHVHQRGIIHRDIKPGNVFLALEPDGHVIPKLVDFGIAKVPKAANNITVDGTVLGTPHYMSPEMIRRRGEPDGRSDLFAVAVMLCEMLTGAAVFKRDAASASLVAVLEDEVDPDPRIPPKLWLELARGLAKNPYERPTSCGAFAASLRAAIDVTDGQLAAAQERLSPPLESEPAASVPNPSQELLSSTLDTPLPGRKKRSLGLALLGGIGGLAIGILLLAAVSKNATPAAAKRTPANANTSAAALASPSVSAPVQSPSAAAPPPAASPPPPPSAEGALASTSAAKRAPPPPSPPAAPPPKRPKAGGVATTPGF